VGVNTIALVPVRTAVATIAAVVVNTIAHVPVIAPSAIVSGLRPPTG